MSHTWISPSPQASRAMPAWVETLPRYTAADTWWPHLILKIHPEGEWIFRADLVAACPPPQEERQHEEDQEDAMSGLRPPHGVGQLLSAVSTGTLEGQREIGAVGDLLAYGQGESTAALKAKDRDQYQFWQGWNAALERVAAAPARDEEFGYTVEEIRTLQEMLERAATHGPECRCTDCYYPTTAGRGVAEPALQSALRFVDAWLACQPH